ncbi:hypothetical protein [Chlorogloeopsis sp. ULAP02]
MIQAIQQQSEDLKNPPMSVIELLQRLEINNKVPKFVSKIRERGLDDVLS